MKGGGTRAGACSDEVFFYAENVDYDPMLRIAYIDFWFVLQNCGSKLASTDVVIEFPDSRFNDGRPRQIKEILLNMKPMESKTISKRITLQIRPGMYIKVKLNPGCREINLAGSTYCRVNIRFGNNFQWYDDK